MDIPEKLAAIGEVLGLSDFEEVLDPTRRKRRVEGWTARRTLRACWPVPDGSVSFGKGSSCIVGEEFEISCAEVEFALAAKNSNWDGGWVKSFNLDSRFPSDWRRALIVKEEACAILSREFDARRFVGDDGFPDLVFAQGSMVVRAECKRPKDFWYGNDGKRNRWKGDGPKESQGIWSELIRRAGARPDGNLTIWWTRLDSSPYAEA